MTPKQKELQARCDKIKVLEKMLEQVQTKRRIIAAAPTGSIVPDLYVSGVTSDSPIQSMIDQFRADFRERVLLFLQSLEEQLFQQIAAVLDGKEKDEHECSSGSDNP